jgi:hypothetical protein
MRHAVHARLNLLLGVYRLPRNAQVVDRDIRAVLGELDRDRLADTRRAAGDENALALQTRHHLASRRRRRSR